MISCALQYIDLHAHHPWTAFEFEYRGAVLSLHRLRTVERSEAKWFHKMLIKP